MFYLFLISLYPYPYTLLSYKILFYLLLPFPSLLFPSPSSPRGVCALVDFADAAAAVVARRGAFRRRAALGAPDAVVVVGRAEEVPGTLPAAHPVPRPQRRSS